MKSSILRRFVLVTQILVLITLMASFYVFRSAHNEAETTELADDLTATTHALAREMSAVPDAGLSQWARDRARLCRVRIALLDSTGRILVSSVGVVKPAMSSVAREQARRVLQPSGSPASSTNLTKHEALASERVQRPDGSIAVLQLEASGAESVVQADVRLLPFALVWISCVAFALALAWFASRPLVHRVKSLKQLAEALLDVPLHRNGEEDASNELGALERSLSGVATQLRTLVDKLRMESARREAILGSMAEGVLAVDNDLRIIFSNNAILRAVGGSRGGQENPPLLALIRDAGLFETLSDVVKTGESRKQRLKITSDKERSFEVQAGPLEMPSGSGAIAILYDMTDLERLEQVRKDFVANVSHEMRTPLAGIIGYAETLMDGALEDKENNLRFLQIIHSSAIRLNSIASDLLVLSELESKVDPRESGRIAVRDVVESAIAIVEKEAEARDVLLIREEIQDLHVVGTRLRLEQAVLNLVANAIKFNQPGGAVRIRVAQDTADEVSITISDTGAGIPSQDLPRIFERFYRVDKGRSRQVGGTGLGLTIVKHVVERMNGRIEVQSQLKYGSTFTVRLPLATPAG
jgi:two-component system phosphate regulon sensor histidine kinase PhoR